MNNNDKIAAIEEWQDSHNCGHIFCSENLSHGKLSAHIINNDIALKCDICDYVQYSVPKNIYERYMRKIANKLLCDIYKEECSTFLCGTYSGIDKRKCEHSIVLDEALDIKVMADFCSSGLWNNKNSGIMIDYDELSLPNDLKDEFKKWVDFYNICFEKDYSTFKPNMSKVLNDIGENLAKKLKKRYPKSRIVYIVENEDGILEKVI